MKKILCCLFALMLLTSAALGEAASDTVRVRFEDGFALSLPADWVSYAVDSERAGSGTLYCLGSADGARLMYVQRWAAEYADLDALRAALEACGGLVLRDSGDTDFITYNLDEGDASGCATLFEGDVLNLLFIPQSDAENMLIAATVMESFEAE